MKVFSVVDNPPTKLNSRGEKRKSVRKKKTGPPPKESLTADQIRAKVEAHRASKMSPAEASKIKFKRFEAQKLQELGDSDEKTIGDVGKNSPNDLATHGKLKSVLSMGAFDFNDKEKAALEKILQD